MLLTYTVVRIYIATYVTREGHGFFPRKWRYFGRLLTTEMSDILW